MSFAKYFEWRTLHRRCRVYEYFRLSLFIESASHSIVFFSYNKSANNTFSREKSMILSFCVPLLKIRDENGSDMDGYH